MGSNEEEVTSQKLRVTMVAWNNDDTRVVTAVNDHSVKIWCSVTGTLIHELKVNVLHRIIVEIILARENMLVRIYRLDIRHGT